MRRKLYRSAIIFFVLLAVSTPAGGQRATEWHIKTLAQLGGQTFLGAGFGVAHRTNGRMRLGLGLNAGTLDGAVAIRPELIGSFHLNPYRREGVSPYAGAGVAVTYSDGDTREYIVAVLGLESRPGTRRGWFVEVGFGGGARLAAGIQMRNRRTRSR